MTTQAKIAANGSSCILQLRQFKRVKTKKQLSKNKLRKQQAKYNRKIISYAKFIKQNTQKDKSKASEINNYFNVFVVVSDCIITITENYN